MTRSLFRSIANATLLIGVLIVNQIPNAANAATLVVESTQAPQLGQTATPVDQIKLAPGFKAELLYSVPKASQGSWVSITHDRVGRLIASDQGGSLYRITPTSISGQPIKVERLPVALGKAHGLLYAFNSLYVVVNGVPNTESGIYRLTDTNGDDTFDDVKPLRMFNGSGEHGPHSVVLAPDKKSLYVCGGNHTDIPKPEKSLLPRNWGEDQLLPRLWDAGGHAVGRMAPGGWICRMDPDGKEFELVSAGFRNEFDIAFNTAGELFTFDADMEWDIGLPWYRPTRVNHVTSGSEFGWRSGTGKWPSYYPDSLPAVIDIGPGSPTGIVFGTGARFPQKYQRSLFIADWSYGIVYALQLQADGATYQATKETFCSAAAFQVADMIVNPRDGALYLAIGGRNTQSGLYRITYVGDEDTQPAAAEKLNGPQNLRRVIERLHAPVGPNAVTAAWTFLSHEDRHIRYAARIALEHQDVALIVAKLNSEKNIDAILGASIAMARNGGQLYQKTTVEALSKVPWLGLTESQKFSLMRAYGLVLIRMGPPTKETLDVITSRFNQYYPANSVVLNRELSKLMIAVGAPDVVAKTLLLLKSAPTQEEQIHYALALSSLKTGWNLPQRMEYFRWFTETASLRGGNSFTGFLNNIREQAIGTLTRQEGVILKQLIATQPPPSAADAELKARPFVKKWTVAELEGLLKQGLVGRDFDRGQKLFTVAQCYKCHRFDQQGGMVGPDLTAAGRRFNHHDLLEAIVEPSKVISDQYQATMFLTNEGQQIVGRVANLNAGAYYVQTDLLNPGTFTIVNVSQIEEMAPSKTSMMPDGLLDTFSADEVLDLIAFVRSGNDRNGPEFKQSPTPVVEKVEPESPPNIVLIISDDQSWTDYSFMDHSMIETPNLDLLAEQSVTYTRGYVPTALSRPSLATIISGMYASQHHISGNDPAVPAGATREFQTKDRNYLRTKRNLIAHVDKIPMLPYELKQKGYLSFQSGKWWEGSYRRGGFTHGMTHGDVAKGGRHGDAGLNIGRDGLKPIFDFVEEAGEKPFFIWYAPLMPHTPHNPPPQLLNLYKAPDRPLSMIKYYAMCEWFDRSCGQLLDGLDRRGVMDNTIVIYVADNGWIQRTLNTEVPDGWSQSFAPKSKMSPFDGGTRTPLMIRWPGKIEPRLDSETLVSSIDIAPTILEACGIKQPPQMTGKSLLKISAEQPLQRKAIFGENFAPDIADIDDPRKSLLHRWCVQGDWKLIKTYPGKKGRFSNMLDQTSATVLLFNLKDDPFEEKDLALQHPDIVGELTRKLTAWYPVK